MSRVFNPGPGMYDSGLGANIAEQPFVTPATKFNAFNQVLDMMSGVAGVVDTAARMSANRDIGAYSQAKAQAQADAAKNNDPDSLIKFYQDHQTDSVPAIREDAFASSAPVYEAQRRYAEERNNRIASERVNGINAQMAMINQTTLLNGTWDDGYRQLQSIIDDPMTPLAAKDALINAQTNLMQNKSAYDAKRLANEQEAYRESEKLAKNTASETSSVVSDIIKDQDWSTYSQLDPSEQMRYIRRLFGDTFIKVSGTGVDTLGPDGLPSEPLLAAAMQREANELYLRLGGKLVETANNANTARSASVLQHSLLNADTEDQIAEAVQIFHQSTSLNNPEDTKKSVEQISRGVIGSLRGAINNGQMDSVVAIRKLNMLKTVIFDGFGYNIGESVSAGVDELMSSMKASISVGLENAATRNVGYTSGMKPEYALKEPVTPEGARLLDVLLMEYAINSGEFDRVEAGLATYDLDALQPTSQTGVMLMRVLQETRNSYSTDTLDTKVGNAYDVAFTNGGIPSEKQLNAVVMPTDAVTNSTDLANLYKMVPMFGDMIGDSSITQENIPQILQSLDPADDPRKTKIFNAAIEVERRLHNGAPLTMESAKSIVSDLESGTRTQVLRGVLRLQAYGGFEGNFLRKAKPSDKTKAVELATKVAVLEDYMRKYHVWDRRGGYTETVQLINQDGKDWFNAWLTDISVVEGTGKREFESVSDLGSQFEDLVLSTEQAASIVRLANIYTARANKPSKSTISDMLMANLKANGFSVDPTSNRLVYDPNRYVVAPEAADGMAREFFSRPLLAEERKRMSEIFGVSGDLMSTGWDYVKAATGLPPDTDISSVVFSLDYGGDLQAGPQGTDQFSVDFLFKTGPQLMVTRRDLANRVREDYADPHAWFITYPVSWAMEPFTTGDRTVSVNSQGPSRTAIFFNTRMFKEKNYRKKPEEISRPNWIDESGTAIDASLRKYLAFQIPKDGPKY